VIIDDFGDETGTCPGSEPMAAGASRSPRRLEQPRPLDLIQAALENGEVIHPLVERRNER
jgi:hypothetical protein